MVNVELINLVPAAIDCLKDGYIVIRLPTLEFTQN